MDSGVIVLPNGRRIGHGQPCFVVAELGQNHNGDVYTATRLMRAADFAEVDAVKFCKRHIPSDLTVAARNAPYRGPESFGSTYGQHREALELTPHEYQHLKDRARYNHWNAVFFATACDGPSVDDLEEAIDPPLYKIASRDLDNLPLLDYVARLGKPMILSRGMGDDRDITGALDTVRRHHNQIVLLHCVSRYPAPPEHWGLSEIVQLRERFDVLTGLSDHGVGYAACIAAVALGAVVVEKHITLSRAMKGRDHTLSLEPDDLRLMVNGLRNVEAGLQTSSITGERTKLGRSIVSARAIPEGRLISEEDLRLKSPGTGLRWRERVSLLGHHAARDIPANVLLFAKDVNAED